MNMSNNVSFTSLKESLRIYFTSEEAKFQFDLSQIL